MKETSINKRIGELIRSHRQRKGLSQESLAMDLKLSVSTISNHERGKGISIGRLYLVLELLDTNIMDFFAEVENVSRNHIASDDIAIYQNSQVLKKLDELESEIEKLKKGKEK